MDERELTQIERERREKTKMVIQVVFLFLLASAIIALIVTTVTLVKNKNELVTDPLIYGMEKHGFISCQCYDESGKDWYSLQDGFIYQSQAPPPNYTQNFANINFSNFKSGEVISDGAG